MDWYQKDEGCREGWVANVQLIPQCMGLFMPSIATWFLSIIL